MAKQKAAHVWRTSSLKSGGDVYRIKINSPALARFFPELQSIEFHKYSPAQAIANAVCQFATKKGIAV